MTSQSSNSRRRTSGSQGSTAPPTGPETHHNECVRGVKQKHVICSLQTAHQVRARAPSPPGPGPVDYSFQWTVLPVRSESWPPHWSPEWDSASLWFWRLVSEGLEGGAGSPLRSAGLHNSHTFRHEHMNSDRMKQWQHRTTQAAGFYQ